MKNKDICIKCPYKKKCRTTKGYSKTRHHLYWPRNEYRNAVERAFRELPENSIYLCRYLHDQLHERESPPKKPSLKVMLEALKSLSMRG